MLYTTHTILVLLLSHTQSLPNPGYYLVKNNQVGGNKPLVGRAEIKDTDTDDEDVDDNSWDMFGLLSGDSNPDKEISENGEMKSDNGFDFFRFFGGEINSTKTIERKTIDEGESKKVESKTFDKTAEDVSNDDFKSKNNVTFMQKLMSLLGSIKAYVMSGADIATEKFTEWGKSLKNLVQETGEDDAKIEDKMNDDQNANSDLR